MPERAQRFILWFLALGLMVGTGIALRFAGGYRRMAGLIAAPALPPNVTLRLVDVTAVGRKDNRRAWKMTARQVDSSKDRTRVDFIGDVNLTLYSGEKPRATLHADTANYVAINQTLLIAGHIQGILKDPQAAGGDLKVETDRVEWSIGNRQVFAPNAVTLTLKDGRITGDQFRVDLKTRDYTMDHFQADFAIDQDAPPSNPLGNLFTPDR